MPIEFYVAVLVPVVLWGFLSGWRRAGETDVEMPQIKQAPPMPPAKPPRQEYSDEWLTVKKSGISHKFIILGALNPEYRYSACGFETRAERLTGGEGARRCPKCERAKGW